MYRIIIILTILILIVSSCAQGGKIDSDLTDSVMQGHILEDSSFGECILTRTDFSGTTFKGVREWVQPNFFEAEAKDVNFSNCKIYFIRMSSANLENADFEFFNILNLFSSRLIGGVNTRALLTEIF